MQSHSGNRVAGRFGRRDRDGTGRGGDERFGAGDASGKRSRLADAWVRRSERDWREEGPNSDVVREGWERSSFGGRDFTSGGAGWRDGDRSSAGWRDGQRSCAGRSEGGRSFVGRSRGDNCSDGRRSAVVDLSVDGRGKDGNPNVVRGVGMNDAQEDVLHRAYVRGLEEQVAKARKRGEDGYRVVCDGGTAVSQLDDNSSDGDEENVPAFNEEMSEDLLRSQQP